MTTRIQPWTEPELMDRESVFEAAVEKALIKTMRALASEAREGILTAAATLPVDPTTEGSYSALQGAVMAEWTAQVDSSLYPFLTSTFTDSAARVVDGVQAASGIVVDQLTGVYADEVLQYAYNRMVGIGESLWLNIRDQLVEGYNAGESIPQIAERLTQVAGLTTPRALTVARTEIISAANNGSYLQMLDAGFDEAVTKVWLATEDTRTRLSHRHADNQGVDLTGEFNVDIYSGDVKTGTEPMEFPGDPSATPGNIINCRCSLAFDFEEEAEEVLVAAAAFTEKDHPRDKDGKFKKKGAADKYIKVPGKDSPPKASAPDAEKVAWIATHKWDFMAQGQKAVLIKSITEPTWEKLSPELKAKIKDAPNQTSHPEGKKILQDAVDKLDSFTPEPDDDADTDVPAGRPVGGVDTKTGKALVPGKPVKLRVQLLYNTTFEDGAIMAVRKDSGERIIWNEKTKKIERQKLSAAGKYETTEALSRGAAYAAWKDENGWTVPDASDFATPEATTSAPQTPSVAVGKPVKIKVQLIYQTPFDDGDIVAVNPSSGDVIKWDAKKKRMVVHHAKGGTTEYTRGALYKEYKDSDGWHLPADKKAAIPAPAPVKKAVPPAKSAKPVSTNVKAGPAKGPGAVADFLKAADPKGLSPLTKKAVPAAAPPAPDPIKDFLGLSQMQKNKIILSMSQKDWDGLSEAEQKAIVKDADHWDEDLPTDAAVDHLSELVKGAKPKAVPAPAKEPFQTLEVLGGENTDKIKDALTDSDVPDGTVLFDQSYTGQHSIITKTADGEASVVVNNGDPETVNAAGLDTMTLIKAINKSKKSGQAKDAALVQTGTEVPDYVASDDANAIYQSWDNDPPGEIWSNGPFSVGLAKNGNLLFLDSKPGGGVGVVKAADVNSENIDKALEAVMAGKTWTVDDAIPEVGPDEIVAPGGSQDVSAGQSDLSLTDSKFQDVVDDWADFQVDDVVYTDDAIEMTKVSKNFVEVFDKKTGKSFNDNVNSLTIEHITDFLELNAPDPAVDPLMPVAPTPGDFPDFMVNIIKNQANDSGVAALTSIFDDGNVEILKGGGGNIAVMKKGGQGLVGLGPDQITKAGLEKAYVDAMAGVVAGPKSTAANAVTPDKAATIKDWAKQGDIPAGEELHNGANFKIVKGAPGAIIIYPKGPDGHANTNSGTAQFLFGDEITSQGIENTLSQMGLTGAPTPSPVVAPAAANVTVTNKPLTSPATQLPLKMSYGLLVNPKTTNYKDGQIIAENPSQGERLVWDGIAKKYLVQLNDGAGNWTQVDKYSKQAAYKNLKDDPGWVTPSAPFVTSNSGDTPGTAPTPSIAGQLTSQMVNSPSTAPSVTTGVKPKFTTVQLNDASDSKLAMLSDADVKKVFDEFKTGKSTIYLTSSDEQIFDAVLRAQKKFNEANPGVSLNMLETIRLVDQHSAKIAGVQNKNLFQQKLINWLESPSGKKKAPEILHEFRLSPAEKAKIEADKKAAAKAQLDAQLKDFHAIRPTLGTPEIRPKDATFVAPTEGTTRSLQDAALAKKPWTTTQRTALKKYTGSYYHSLNGMLRGKITPTPELIKDASEAQKGMRPIEKDILVYRGTGAVEGVFPDNLAEYQKLIGKTAVEPGFFSTSINKPFGGKIKIEFEVPKGTPAAWVKNYTDKNGDVKTLSNVPGENEVLLAAGTKFEYVSAQQVGYQIVVRVRVVP